MATSSDSAAAGMNPVSSDENSTPEELQFVRAEPVKPEETAQCCVGCKPPIAGTYFHANGKVVCPSCAEQVRKSQQAPPASSLGRAALYGGGAAFAGFAIYTIVAITTGFQIGLIAILVGYMVGRAVRRGARGLGGRPQQILAVALTYFSITTSYIPVILYQEFHRPAAERLAARSAAQKRIREAEAAGRKHISPGRAVFYLLLVTAAAPFLSLTAGASGILTLVIIFFGLSRAWRLTARTGISLLGPYEMAAASA